MRQVFLAATAAIALAAGVARAGPLDDAKSGLAALDKGNNLVAIRLFTQALDSGRLTRSDQELAHVKRAEAYLARGDGKLAEVDANQALDIDPRDSEAVATLDRAHALLNPAPAAPRQATASASAEYQAAMAKYDAQKKADADAYARQVTAYDDKIKAQETKHEAELTAWRADVEACKAGDATRCGTPAPTQTAQAARPAVAPKPTVTAVKTAPKPVKPRAPLPPPERPVIY
ncbi:MAG: hypothetical protein ACREEB_16665 [Caulobacteraceae bacterium]